MAGGFLFLGGIGTLIGKAIGESWHTHKCQNSEANIMFRKYVTHEITKDEYFKWKFSQSSSQKG